ncbi:hypothetical protein SAMN05444149_10885 [Pseudosulfitobacter pseudonitzschiae]|uniref:Uncharacterized protein n=1 Tax=Pseudosulfitobacter pseudonitzschiae TaxID=1402135 RepID=A0A073IUF7_9RHOB|nr:hypothetical protein [Pseudosulfitobacter pseudonitzschiae]KEJ93968.1 hypothetical protein SUH3_11905 [Pseudosulfitobacter pseudonitzschiae]SHG01198.1 hypothetical protein SAMN05444149_10885 [Pseudosulfitobacter pseudonitzschiae]
MSQVIHICEIPPTDTFRAWVLEALELVEVKPASVSRSIGAGVNSVGVFLRDPARGITLSLAVDIERHLRQAAADQGKELPEITSREAE